MTAEPRARLAARQAELISALYGGPLAPGLDPRRVTLTSAALARKRARAVAMTWPALARGLGADFAPLFIAYARATPPPEGARWPTASPSAVLWPLNSTCQTTYSSNGCSPPHASSPATTASPPAARASQRP
jgi:hypothetical protein